MSEVTILHPSLGEIRGRTGAEVIQFLNVKYGHLKHRFGPATMWTGASSTEGATDCSCFGRASDCNLEFDLIQQTLPLDKTLPISTMDGLNLNITVPNHGSCKKLPVLVFLHGGGLSMGSGNWPQYDMAGLVKRALNKNKPFIGVTINYRTGVFGFLTSRQLRDGGFPANNGLHDQRLSFQWIKEHISGFGGDPMQVTVMGQSAGGVSAMLHLQSMEPLFKRMINMSGTCLLLRPVPPEAHEVFYQTFCEGHKVENLSMAQRLQTIEATSDSNLYLNTPSSVAPLPMLDGDLLKTVCTFANVEQWSPHTQSSVPGMGWCEELLIGDSQMDGSIFDMILRDRSHAIADKFELHLKGAMPGHEHIINDLLANYQIASSNGNTMAYRGVLQLFNDISFYLPARAFARNFPGPTYVYHLNQPNPWSGRFQGETNHIFDVALTFGNFDHVLPLEAAEVGHAFADDIISFVAGEKPWQATSRAKPVAKVFGGEMDAVSELREDVPERTGRRGTLLEYESFVDLDTLLAACMSFLNGH